MELPPSNEEQPQAEIAAQIDLLLSEFNRVGRVVSQRHINAIPSVEEEAYIDHHDRMVGILGDLPQVNLPQARYAYEQLTDSDDPRDREWAARFFPAMLAVDKEFGLSMLGRLIGIEETEQAVQDVAWFELTTTVAEENLLTLNEAVEYIDTYHRLLRNRWLARIRQARASRSGETT